MTRVYKEAVVDYSQQEIFDLINNVEHYPEFVPGCISTEILSKQDNMLTAKVVVSKAIYTKSFTTKNTFYPYERVNIELIEGPLKRLSGAWILEPISDNSTKVKLDLDISLKSDFLDMIFGDIVHNMMSTMVEAFVDRAKVVYE